MFEVEVEPNTRRLKKKAWRKSGAGHEREKAERWSRSKRGGEDRGDVRERKKKHLQRRRPGPSVWGEKWRRECEDRGVKVRCVVVSRFHLFSGKLSCAISDEPTRSRGTALRLPTQHTVTSTSDLLSTCECALMEAFRVSARSWWPPTEWGTKIQKASASCSFTQVFFFVLVYLIQVNLLLLINAT